MGSLHGGVSVVLAETAATMGAWMNIDREKQIAVGIEINANPYSREEGWNRNGHSNPIACRTFHQ